MDVNADRYDENDKSLSSCPKHQHQQEHQQKDEEDHDDVKQPSKKVRELLHCHYYHHRIGNWDRNMWIVPIC